jgi:hypothetical protein
VKAPAIERYRLTLRLTAQARFHFLHGAVVRGLLSRALADHDLPVGVIPATPESGRATYQAGEAYHLGLTLVGEDRALASDLLDGLSRAGRATPDGQRSPTLGGNYELEAAERLEPLDLDAETAALGAACAHDAGDRSSGTSDAASSATSRTACTPPSRPPRVRSASPLSTLCGSVASNVLRNRNWTLTST